MTQVYSLDIDDIIRELNLGRATVKFILDRFSDSFAHNRIEGRDCYSQDTLATLIRIKNLMDEGLLPSRIEKILTQPPQPAPQTQEHPVEDVRMSQDALAFIQNLFQDIKVHQNRIARAHEKRAEAEERKAVAIEKRADAEGKKAQAMNNIAAALQEMSRQRPVDTQTMEIAGQAAQVLTMNETQDFDMETDREDQTIDLDAGLNDTDLTDLFDHPEPDSALTGDLDGMDSDDLDLDDLTIEFAEQEDDETEPDDLNRLKEASSIPEEPDDDLKDLLDDPGFLPDLDDLDLLVEETAAPEETGPELDDLSLLVESPAQQDAGSQELDDLSLLVDVPAGESDADMDDLHALVEDVQVQDLDDLSRLVDLPAQDTALTDMDDLSLLVDDGPAADQAPALQKDMDDLSALVDAPAQGTLADMDDLSALVSTEDLSGKADAKAPSQPSLKPDITPEQDLAKYKAAVMKIIIDLKNQGLTAGETTDRLNRDQVPTISGKAEWREKAIAKIYGFIESAQ